MTPKDIIVIYGITLNATLNVVDNATDRAIINIARNNTHKATDNAIYFAFKRDVKHDM